LDWKAPTDKQIDIINDIIDECLAKIHTYLSSIDTAIININKGPFYLTK